MEVTIRAKADINLFNPFSLNFLTALSTHSASSCYLHATQLFRTVHLGFCLNSSMGDCTIHLLIESKLLTPTSAETNSDEFHLVPSSHVLSADSTLVELTSLLSRTLSSSVANYKNLLSVTCIIDASYYPAKIINQTVRDHPDASGPKSKTLQSMGWFPSGKLVILPVGAAADKNGNSAEEELLTKFIEWQSRHVLNEEEFVYNLPSAAVPNDATRGVQWTGAGSSNTGMKPTDIFNAVQSRFDSEQSTDQTKHVQKTSQKKKLKRTEQQRHERLDSILGNLKKSKKTSVQVRNMLIKSRSVGDKKLRMEDRFHLEIIRVDDTCNEESGAKESSDYRFYSRQTTAGKVASAVAPSLGQDRAAEFLVAVSFDDKKRYRRLRNTMALHDAQREGWLNDFDTVLIRVYMISSDGELTGPSKSVLDAESDDEIDCDMEVEAQVQRTNSSTSVLDIAPTKSDEIQPSQSSNQLQIKIQTILQMAEAGEVENTSIPNKSAKKKSVSKQVQNMLIKSKASGDRKVKQEDRVFLEVIVFQDNNEKVVSSSLTASYWFFEKRKTLGHIIKSLGIGKSGGAIEFIVSNPGRELSFQKLPTNLTIMSAMKDKTLDNFDRVIVRVPSSEN
jgi:hypothetical protein